MNYIKVKKVNLELKTLEHLLKQSNLSLNDIKNDNDIYKQIKEKLGIDINDIILTDGDLINIDIDKIIAVGEVETLLGFDNLKAFSIWFDYDKSHCWYIYPEYYNEINNYIMGKNLNKPLFD